MFTETRKLHLIEKIIRLKNEDTWVQIERIVKSSSATTSENKASAHDFLGLISKKDAELMDKAIQEGCEQIHPDDWK